MSENVYDKMSYNIQFSDILLRKYYVLIINKNLYFKQISSVNHENKASKQYIAVCKQDISSLCKFCENNMQGEK